MKKAPQPGMSSTLPKAWTPSSFASPAFSGAFGQQPASTFPAFRRSPAPSLQYAAGTCAGGALGRSSPPLPIPPTSGFPTSGVPTWNSRPNLTSLPTVLPQYPSRAAPAFPGTTTTTTSLSFPAGASPTAWAPMSTDPKSLPSPQYAYPSPGATPPKLQLSYTPPATWPSPARAPASSGFGYTLPTAGNSRPASPWGVGQSFPGSSGVSSISPTWAPPSTGVSSPQPAFSQNLSPAGYLGSSPALSAFAPPLSSSWTPSVPGTAAPCALQPTWSATPCIPAIPPPLTSWAAKPTAPQRLLTPGWQASPGPLTLGTTSLWAQSPST
eukprot:RCo042925